MGEIAKTPVASGQEVPMGTVVNQFPVEMYKVNENTIDLMTILTANPIVTKTYYHDKIGFRFHELPAALQLGLKPSIHYNFLAALWNASKDGSQIIDNRYTIVVLRLADEMYKRIVKKFELNGDLRKLVLQVYLEGELKYQKMNFEIDNTKKPPYMLNGELFNTIKADVVNFKQYIYPVVGGTIDEERFWELWKAEGTAIEKQEEGRFKNKGVITGQGGGQRNAIDIQHQEVRQSGLPANQLKQDDFNFDNSGQQQQNFQQQNTQQNNGQGRQVDDAVILTNQNTDKTKEFFGGGNPGDFSFE